MTFGPWRCSNCGAPHRAYASATLSISADSRRLRRNPHIRNRETVNASGGHRRGPSDAILRRHKGLLSPVPICKCLKFCSPGFAVRVSEECARSPRQQPHKPVPLGRSSCRISPTRGCGQVANVESRPPAERGRLLFATHPARRVPAAKSSAARAACVPRSGPPARRMAYRMIKLSKHADACSDIDVGR